MERGGAALRFAGKRAPLLTGPFILVCLATAFFYVSFYLLLPVMPLYVQGLGATPTQIGLVIGCFAGMAMLLRLPSGWLIDRRGSQPVLLAGLTVFFLASLGYTVAGSVVTLLALRVFHGMGMGLYPTAAAVLVAELAPAERRGEAMGWFGIANSVGLLAGPAAGPPVASRLGFGPLFLVAAGLAGLGLVCLALLPRRSRPEPVAGLVIRWGDLFSRAAVLPSVILLGLSVSYGIIMAFVPIIGEARGLHNAGLFYTGFAGAMLLVRSKAGQISDRHGRVAIILPGMLATAVASVMLALASGPFMVLLAAVVFGVAFGSVQPALMALTADRSPLEERGKAMGTFFTAWELGIASGATAFGWLLTYADFTALLLAIAGLPLAAALLSLRARSKTALSGQRSAIS